MLTNNKMDSTFIHTIYIVNMSERCIHCGASEKSLLQPEYACQLGMQIQCIAS